MELGDLCWCSFFCFGIRGRSYSNFPASTYLGFTLGGGVWVEVVLGSMKD